MKIFPIEVLEERALQNPEAPYAGCLRLGTQTFQDFKILSNREVYDLVKRYGSVIRSLGLQKGDRVAIMGPNVLDWVLVDFAAQACGYVTVPLYTQSHPQEVEYILEESEAKFLFYDETLFTKVNQFTSVHRMAFQAIWEQALKIASDFKPDCLSEHEINTFVYTSGTQGSPKGVMHSALNFRKAFDSMNASTVFSEKDRMISYLPLSHVVERNVMQYGTLFSGAPVYFVENVDRVAKFLAQIRPTCFFAVPRIWDMIRFKIEREIETNKLLVAAKAVLPSLVFKATAGQIIRRKLGLDRARLLISGAAQLNPETQQSLASVGIKVAEGYGLTETLGITAIDIGLHSPGKVGRPFAESIVKIADDGEICTKTPYLFKGYYKKPKETAEAMRDGWFHTGDIGTLSEEGFLKITDRKKDIFKISNGKYVAPLPIESSLKNHPAIREVMIYGDQRPHCVAVASVDLEQADEDTILKLMSEVNSRLSPHEQVKSMACLEETWSVDEGHLTPSLKVKRREIIRRYSQTIDYLYDTRPKVKFYREGAQS